MKKPSLLVALLLISSIAAAPLPYVQMLQDGTWGGTVTPPEGGEMAIQFEVSNEDGLAITIMVPEMGMEIVTEDPKLEDSVLIFGFAVENDTIGCALERQDDGSYAGECIDTEGVGGWMTMTPPQGADG